MEPNLINRRLGGESGVEYAAIAHVQDGLLPVWVRNDVAPCVKRGKTSRLCRVRVTRFGAIRGQLIWVDIRMLETPQAPRKRGAAERRRDSARKRRYLEQSGSPVLAQGAKRTETTVTTTEVTYAEKMREGVLGDGGELGK